MKIVTLIENLVYKKGLYAEHGLAIYIETENKKILFDTGQSGLFLENAKTLGISVAEIDILVLSHGHYDHTGGLYPFLRVNSKAEVYAKEHLFIPKYGGRNRFRGTLFNRELLKNRLVSVDVIRKIDECIFVMPDIDIVNSIDTHFKGMNKKANNKFIPDEFDDELFLVIKQDERIHIITACSHRGITNICNAATSHFNLPVGLILGGFHMNDCTRDQYGHISNYFRILHPESIGVCHCTGVEKYAEMYNDCKTRLFYNFTGNEVII